jgi:hypothetical protein
MKRWQWLAPVAIILLIAGVVALNHVFKHRNGPTVTMQCADLRAGCRTLLGDRQVSVGIVGELKLLKAFEVWVRVEGVEKIQASFTMTGMDMGFNLYTLRPDGQGAYRAKITLPMCISGRHDWLLHIDLDRQRLTVPFVTGL